MTLAARCSLLLTLLLVSGCNPDAPHFTFVAVEPEPNAFFLEVSVDAIQDDSLWVYIAGDFVRDDFADHCPAASPTGDFSFWGGGWHHIKYSEVKNAQWNLRLQVGSDGDPKCYCAKDHCDQGWATVKLFHTVGGFNQELTGDRTWLALEWDKGGELKDMKTTDCWSNTESNVRCGQSVLQK